MLTAGHPDHTLPETVFTSYFKCKVISIESDKISNIQRTHSKYDEEDTSQELPQNVYCKILSNL